MEEIRENKDQIQKLITSIASCQHLLPYLGLIKYEELLKMTKIYYKNKGVDREGIVVALQNQDDPYVHNLFISIIKLMSFFHIQ